MTMKLSTARILLILLALVQATSATAQSFETLGTRAKGMGGAQVAAVEDASAVYWNPAGLASGSYFSMVLDWSKTSTNPPDAPAAGRQEGILFALGAPAFGFTYYRLESTGLRVGSAAAPTPLDHTQTGAGTVRVATLVTHNLGATVVQSLFPGVAVGATLKYVKARGGIDVRADGDRDSLLAHGAALNDTTDREFDTDIGVMASGGGLKVGLTVRNLLEPKFQVTPEGDQVQIQRQARAGVAVKPGNLVVAADFDLLKTAGPFGDVRDMALGAEARVVKRAYVRGGFHMNTLSLPEVGHMPSYGVGGSVGVTASVFVDGEVTTGSDKSAKGWGLSARFVY